MTNCAKSVILQSERTRKELKKMKKSTAIVVIVLVAALVFGLCGVLMNQLLNPANTYAMTCEVVELDRENDLVVCEDFNGNLWEFYGCEDWQIDDIASLLMDDNGTPTIYDDEIVSAQYNGTFEGWN